MATTDVDPTAPVVVTEPNPQPACGAGVHRLEVR
jgi:hypothetical protein